MSHGSRAVLAGAAIGGILAWLPLLAIVPRNPWFLDAPLSFLALASIPLALLGAAAGWALARLGRVPLGITLLLAGLAIAGPPLLASWPRPAPPHDLRLLVLGMDGATFDVLDRLELPAFRALEAEGARADLHSAEPMFSPLLWTTLSTGRSPEAHGIHGFRVRADDCRAARLWEPMQAAGLRVGIYKWLVTWPPQEVRGFMVPAWLAPAPDTWPPDLSFVKEIELSRRLERTRVAARRSAGILAWEGSRHGLRWSTLVAAARYAVGAWRAAPEWRQLEGQHLRTRMDRDVFVWALHAYRPDVATFTDYATDAAQHRAWGAWAAGAPGGEALVAAYVQADGILGDLRHLAPSARVVVISDHGFEALPPGGDARFAAPRTEALRALAAAAVGRVEASRLGHKVVLTALDGDPAEARARLEAFVASLVRTSTRRPLFAWEPVPGDPRSLGLTLADAAISDAELAADTVAGRPLSDLAARTRPWSGVHAARGVFLAAGPGIARGVRLPDLGLLDVAPILATLAGVPPARDLEGRVPSGLLVGDAALPPGPSTWDDLAGRVRPFVPVPDRAVVDETQLRALGYLD